MSDWRKHILFYTLIAMMLSLFVSRVATSVSIVVFTVVCFFHNDIKGHLKNFISSPVLWSMSLLFLLPLLSGLWSDDKEEWRSIMRIKLPLMALPLAFASPFTFFEKQWRRLAFIFISLVTAGTAWSIFQYIPDVDAVNEGYLQAKTMVTPLENDHVRFSWLVSIAVLLSGWLYRDNRGQKKIVWLLSLVILWLIIFLHILAARTGLFCLYIILLATLLRLIFKKGKAIYGTILLVLVIALPLTAYYLFPTFHNKVKYFQYDFEYVKDAHYLPGGNDATRVISLKAGWSVMTENGIRGVGFGDISRVTGEWYNTHYPEMRKQDNILPSNEWLIYGAGCGFPGLVIFTFVLLAPFFIRVKNKWEWWLLNALVAVSFLSDIGLEVQFGVFIYSFIVLLGWKSFQFETRKE